MEVKVQSQIFGQRFWSSKTLLLPDHVAPYFERYVLDIVEYPEIRSMGLFFRKKNVKDVDVLSYTIYRPSIQANIVYGFKTAFEELAELEKKPENVPPDQPHCGIVIYER